MYINDEELEKKNKDDLIANNEKHQTTPSRFKKDARIKEEKNLHSSNSRNNSSKAIKKVSIAFDLRDSTEDFNSNNSSVQKKTNTIRRNNTVKMSSEFKESSKQTSESNSVTSHSILVVRVRSLRYKQKT